MSLRYVIVATATAVVLCSTGCKSSGKHGGKDSAVVSQAAPDFRNAAAAYNERIESLGRFRAQATVQFRYGGKDGETRVEQPEGTIQVVRPDRLALSLGKLGQVKFWLGSDETRYWWLDMLHDEPIAYVGEHVKYNEQTARQLVLSLPPRTLIRVLCLTPMDQNAWGATQWSTDGLRLGITIQLEGGGRQRVWVDPANYCPIKSELFDATGNVVFVVDMTGDERVEVEAGSVRGGSPWIPKSYSVYRLGEQDPVARISLSGAKNDGVNDKAFDFETVTSTYGVEQIVDIDNEP
jgi:hypothetical protein